MTSVIAAMPGSGVTGAAGAILAAIAALSAGSMVWWGLAAVVPIVLHLWRRRRHRETPWAATEFVLAAMRKQAARVRVEQWLLLAVRAAIPLLLALALADPQWFASGHAPVDDRDEPVHRILVVDASFSMNYQTGGSSRLQAARDALTRRVHETPEGDGYSVLVLGDPSQIVLPGPVFNQALVASSLHAVNESHGGADLRSLWPLVRGVFAETRRLHKRFAKLRVTIATDLARITWDSASSDDDVAELRRLIADGVSFELLDVGAPRASNAAVTGLALRDPLVTTDRDGVVEAEVRDFGSSESSAKRIEFLLDGRKVAEQSIELPPNGRAVASASFRCDAPGPHVLEAVLHADGLELDNHRWLGFEARDRVRVLCVEGRPGEARYVALALESQDDGKRKVQVDVDAEHALVDRELTDFDLICLCNVGRVAAAEANAIRSALEQGVGVAVFPGDELRWEDYRETLASDGARRVLPARPSAPSPVGVYRFVAGEYRDPLVASFRGQERAGLLSTPVWKYVPLEPASGSARVALSFDDGRPAIVHERIGRGLSTLFATAASPDSLDRATTPPTPWSAWATWPSFLPIIQETLRLSLSTRSEDRNVTVGDEWLFARPDVLPQAQLTVSRIGGAFNAHQAVNLVLLRDEGEFGVRWRTGPLMQCGPWSLRIDSPAPSASETSPLVVNVDSRESDLERVAWEQLPVELRGGSATRPADGAQSVVAPDAVGGSGDSTVGGGANGAVSGAPASAAQSTFARLLLVVVVALAVFENQLLSRGSRRRAP